jgi:diguanylate cyclase (GGDEF)-like protein
MSVGTDTPGRLGTAEGDPLLAGLRRLMRLADGVGEPAAIMRALASELFELLGAEEVHVYSLAASLQIDGERAAGDDGDPVVVYMFGGEAQLSYEVPHTERPPGVAWVASTGQHVLATGARELAAVMPRLAATGCAGCALLLGLTVRGEVEAVVVVVRRWPIRGCRPNGGCWPNGGYESEASVSPLRSEASVSPLRQSECLPNRSTELDERAIQRATALVDQAANALALLRARAEAGTDAVTGCMNHRAMRRRLREEIDRATRAGGSLACMLMDLDDFKLVNDRHGHPAGDAVLRGVARALMGEFRAFDRVARYGGDEFVVILPNADLESATLAAARALQRLAGVPSFALHPGVSASIGVAQWRPAMSAGELLEACDEALLRGKREGKGRVAQTA